MNDCSKSLVTVTIRECKGPDGREWTSKHRAASWDEAAEKAIRKHFGTRAGLWQDSGLARGYGQIVRPSSGGGSDCITGRIRVDVDWSGAE